MKRMLLKVILICIVLSFAGGRRSAATEDGDGFNRGNALYAAGNFGGAVGVYEEQVHRGRYSANLFYNLADAYHRQGNRGRAILNYQRALILDPTHAEAAANLAFVRGQKSTASTRSGWGADLLPWLAAAGGWAAVAGLLAVALRGRWRLPGLTLFVSGLTVCAAAILTIRSLDDSARNPLRAVVVADSAPALYAPADNSKVITTLTAGGELRVLSDQGAWVYVQLGDGTRGWVAANKIERVVPP